MDKHVADELTKIIAGFLNSIEAIPVDMAFLDREDRYDIVYVLSAVRNLEGELVSLGVLHGQYPELMRKINTIFPSRISREGLSRKIGEKLQDIKIWLAEEYIVTKATREICDWIVTQSESSYRAIIPVYYLHLDDDIIDIPLARCTLYRGSMTSELALLVDKSRMRDFVSVSPGSNFLAVGVSGDDQTARQQAIYEAEEALKVLRFVTSGKAKSDDPARKGRNDACKVQLYPNLSSVCFYYNPKTGDHKSGSAQIMAESLHFITSDDLRLAKERFQLERINRLYSDIEQKTEIAKRILYAIELFDSGVTAGKPWQSLYRYVASINTLVNPRKGKEHEIVDGLRGILNEFKRFTGIVTGTELEYAIGQPWETFISLAGELVREAYVNRGRILHGELIEVSSEVVHGIQEIARNVICAVIDLSEKNNWTRTRDIDRWLKKRKQSAK